jgi:septum formation inhibitor MinC
MRKLTKVIESKELVDYFAIISVNHKNQAFVSYFIFEDTNTEITEWESELQPLLDKARKFCEKNNIILQSY